MRQRPLFLNVDLSFQPNKTINKSPVQRTKTSLKETQKSYSAYSLNFDKYQQTSVEQQADLQPQQMLNKKFQLNKLLISK